MKINKHQLSSCFCQSVTPLLKCRPRRPTPPRPLGMPLLIRFSWFMMHYPTLRHLNWLPITQRIDLQNIFSYFQNSSFQSTILPCWTPHHWNSFSLLTIFLLLQHKLKIPYIKSKQGEHSFSFAAPTIWNSLPAHLRTCTSITIFHALLKTHFFPP